jgi:hypothetical protein
MKAPIPSKELLVRNCTRISSLTVNKSIGGESMFAKVITSGITSRGIVPQAECSCGDTPAAPGFCYGIGESPGYPPGKCSRGW